MSAPANPCQAFKSRLGIEPHLRSGVIGCAAWPHFDSGAAAMSQSCCLLGFASLIPRQIRPHGISQLRRDKAEALGLFSLIFGSTKWKFSHSWRAFTPGS